MDSVVHFEMPAEDRKRMVDFYARVFGWKAHMLGEDMGNYTLVTTTETDAEGMPKKVGAINGGLFPKTEDNAHPSLVIGIRDIQESMKHITAAGGKVLGEPVEIPGYGLYVSFIDTEGNRLSVMQPNEAWLTKN